MFSGGSSDLFGGRSLDRRVPLADDFLRILKKIFPEN
jgi:hypothetical protein